MELLYTCRIPTVSLYILLYCCSVLDRLLLTNAMDKSIALPKTSSYLQLKSSPSSTAMLHEGLLLMHPYIGITAFWHHSISCMCLISPMIWLFHTNLGITHSTSKQHWLMSTSSVVHILLQLLVRIYPGSLLYLGMTAVLFLFYLAAYQSVP